jgi:HNH endonuclease
MRRTTNQEGMTMQRRANGQFGIPSTMEQRLERLSIQITESGCRIWEGHINPRGYGNISLTPNKKGLAHRVAYETWRGPIPKGLTIDHLCRVRCCINPWHMECVTHRTNVLRGQSIAAQYAQRTHCSNGHALTTSTRRPNRRVCTLCPKTEGR